MAKFKQVPQSFLLKTLVGFFRNTMKNFDDECLDNDFFTIIRNGIEHDKAVELIELAYSEQEIEEMTHARSRRNRLDLSDPLNEVFQSLWNSSRNRDKCRAVLDVVCDYILADCTARGRDPVEERFGNLKEILKLSDLEAELMALAYVCDQTCFSWPLRVGNRDKPLHYAMALDRAYHEVTGALAPKGRLMKLEVLDCDFDFNSRAFGNYMDGSDDEALQRRFYSCNAAAEVLPWEFYGELAEKDGAVICDMIASGAGRCNILLYGAPGTGKTSFARSLARRLGRTAFEIAQGDDDGRNMKAESRMIGIRVCNANEDPADSVVIVDEADELLRGSDGFFGLFGIRVGGKSTEKGVMNTILDEMRIPAVWICNTPAEEMDESVRRRFDYSVRFERMNNAQRISVWRNIVRKLDLGALVPDAKIPALAAKYTTSAGGISTVLANVKRLAPAPEKADGLIATLMEPHCRLMGIGGRGGCGGFLPAKDYSLDGLNVAGKVEPARIVKTVRNYLDGARAARGEDRPRMNILLYGPPGTGKTEFVKHLAHELDREVLVLKGSDILAKYVGESERNIADTFRRAEAAGAILFFDEIDGLLHDRRAASRSWEVTQVNEFLQQMENFKGVFVAATNFSDNLDRATKRRFTFKLKFGFLDDAGQRSFFERMFHTELTDGELDELKAIGNLTPGDFRTVRQELFYLGDEVTNADRLAALREESAFKDEGESTGRIGFGKTGA